MSCDYFVSCPACKTWRMLGKWGKLYDDDIASGLMNFIALHQEHGIVIAFNEYSTHYDDLNDDWMESI
jgi:hypothetical protein